MVLAFALPALFLATAHRFEQAAADEVAAQIVADTPAHELALAVQGGGRLEPATVRGLNAQIVDRLTNEPGLDLPTLTVFTPSGSASTVQADGSRDAIAATSLFFARDGAIESLELIDSVDATGVFVSEDFAARGELVAGAEIDVVIEGVPVVVPVQGVYENLWPEPPDWWRELPPRFIPVRDRSIGRPNIEWLIVEEDTLLQFGVPGVLRWDAAATPPPTDLAALTAAVESYASVEEDLLRDPGLVAASQEFTGVSGTRAFITSSMGDALADTTTAIRSIDGPLAAAQAAGATLGLLAVAANASFLAFRRRRTWRVFAAGGDGPLRLFGLAAVQSLTPAVLGAVIGVLASAGVTSTLVPDGAASFASIRPLPIIILTGLALGIAAVVTALIAGHLGDQRRERPTQLGSRLLLPLLAFAIAGWIQVGSQTFRGSISPVVVFTPIAVLAAAAGLVVVGQRFFLKTIRTPSPDRRLPLLLGLRRSAAASVAGMALAGALAVSIGLSIFAVSMDETRRASVSAKSITQIGSESSASLVEPVPADQIPDGMTVLARSNVFITPGEETVEVVAIDDETYADAVPWPAAFGSLTPAEIVDLLERPPNGDIPAVALSSRPVPDEGTFGIDNNFGYRIVGQVDSAPLAPGSRAMLLIRADALEGAAREWFGSTFATEFGRQPTADDTDEFYQSPLDGYRLTLVSNLRSEELARVTMANEFLAWEFVDRNDIVEAPEERVVRWSFRYLRLVGYASLIISLLSVLLYARERKDARFHADRVGRTLGITRTTTVRAAGVEYGLLAVVALVPALLAAVAVAARIAPLFERGPFPPGLTLSLPVGHIAALAVISLVVVVVVGVAVERFSNRGER